MNIIEKLGITKGPWSLSGSYDQLIVNNEGERIRDVLFESWDSHKKKGCTPDTIMVSVAPEMLDALIRQAINFEDNKNLFPRTLWKSWNDYTIPIIEKATGKTWEQIKGLIDG